MGGPILIAQVAGQQAQRGLSHLLHFTAVINVNLAIFNLLPIPILDGGHLLFLFIELLIGRPPSLRSREMAFRVGFVVIISLVVLVFYTILHDWYASCVTRRGDASVLVLGLDTATWLTSVGLGA